MAFDPTTRTALSPAEMAMTVNDTHVNHRLPCGHKQINLDIVAHVVTFGPCGFSELYDLFGAHADEGKALSTERFRSKLGHLTHSGQIVSTGSAGARRWRAPLKGAVPVADAAGATNVVDCSVPVAGLPKWVGPMVPPRSFDCMHGDVYVPERTSVPRPGSEDFKRLPSHGTRC